MSDPLAGTGAGPVDGPAPVAGGVAAVRLDGISKRYGRVVACDGVDMTLERGRVHGILGENGAGKSTLMKILIGLVQPDAGSIAVHGKRIEIADPLAASDLGIAMVHQHYSLVEPLTVWENVILGERVRLDRTQACERVAAISARYGLGVDPLATVSRLTAGQRQRVEIIKCLRREPEIIVFDEPTSVLTPAESEQLFSVLRAVVVEEHRAVALVSHKLDEILHATDEVTIMRAGRVVDRLPTIGGDGVVAGPVDGRPTGVPAVGSRRPRAHRDGGRGGERGACRGVRRGAGGPRGARRHRARPRRQSAARRPVDRRAPGRDRRSGRGRGQRPAGARRCLVQPGLVGSR